MKHIIEKQKIKAFLRKLLLEWPDKIERYDIKTESLAFIYLHEKENPNKFCKSLFPKVKLFVDFEGYLELFILNIDGEGNKRIYFND